MATIEFDIAGFRAAFPAYASEQAYPDIRLQGYWQEAICFLSPDVCACDEACRARMLNLMVAHLAAIEDKILSGQTVAVVQSATVDKVSVTLVPPPIGDSMFKHWLNLTQYGTRLLAMLSVKSVGGRYVGGSDERSSFRKGGGVF